MTSLPHNSPSLTSLPNGWWQIGFTLTLPFTVEVGARLQMGRTLLAPWRIEGQRIDCLALPSAIEPDTTQPISLKQQGKPLAHIEPNQQLLITGEHLGIADVLYAASKLKHHAAHTLILLAADTFPCQIKPAKFIVNTLPDAIAACPLLEDWGFANRLINDHLPGCTDVGLETLNTQLSHYVCYPYR